MYSHPEIADPNSYYSLGKKVPCKYSDTHAFRKESIGLYNESMPRAIMVQSLDELNEIAKAHPKLGFLGLYFKSDSGVLNMLTYALSKMFIRFGNISTKLI